MFKLELRNNSLTLDITDQYIVKGITSDDKLNTELTSSSSTRKVTISHDYPNTVQILDNLDDIQATLKDVEGNTETTLFTGYVSNQFNWTIDDHGGQALQLTLEDMGTRKLKTIYSKDRSVLISGTASYCISTICGVAGINTASGIPSITTQVQTVAKSGETCEKILKDLCKEVGYAYYFTNEGKLNLKPLSVVAPISYTTITDDALYESIKLQRQARKYKGSRIAYKKLGTKSNALIYRDITNQSSSHKDCWIEFAHTGDEYPADGGATIQAVDLAQGKEVFAISNISPTLTWAQGTGTTAANGVTQRGADSLFVNIQCTGVDSVTHKGVISKLEARASMTYVDSTDIVYGEGDSTVEDLYEDECRWIHDLTSARRYANFTAQYYKYCSRKFTFKTKELFDLGEIIYLNDNIYTTLASYLIIEGRTSNGVSDVYTYTASSISAFDYTKATTDINEVTPPSETYVEIPDDFENITMNITVSPSTFYKDLRNTGNNTLYLTYWWNGENTAPAQVEWEIVASDGTTTYTEVKDTLNTAHVLIPFNADFTSYTIKAWVTGMRTNTYAEYNVPVEDVTTYNKNWGTLTALPQDVVLTGDFFIAGSNFSSYVLGVPYTYNGTSWTPLTADSPDNVNRLFNLLGNALSSDLSVPSVSALYAWFGTLVAQEAAIKSLFSEHITILDPGYIQSENYTPSSERIVCDADTSGVATLDRFSFDSSIFVSHTWGYGVYRFVCTQGGRYSGTWDVYQDSTRKDDDLSASDLSYYGITLRFDGEGYTAHTGDVIVVTYGEQAVPGQGFYLGSDGVFKCYDATMENTTSTNLIVNGDSYFHGTVDTEVFKTQIANPQEVPSGGIQGGASNQQAKNIIDVLVANDYPMNASHVSWTVFIPASLPDYPSAGVAYVSYWTNNSTYHLGFFDSSFTRIPVNQMGFTLAGQTGVNDYIWSGTSNGEYFTQNPVIKVYQGGSNVIWMDVPFAPTEGIASVPVKGVIAGAEANYGNYKYRPLWIRTL